MRAKRRNHLPSDASHIVHRGVLGLLPVNLTRSCILQVAICASVALGTAACGGDIDEFDVTQSGTVTVPAGTIVDDLLQDLAFEGFGDIQFSETEEFQNRDVSPSSVDSIRLQSMQLEIVEGSSNFDWLDRIAFDVDADGQPEQRIANRDPVPTGVRSFAGNASTAVNVKPYATQDSMSLTSSGSGRAPDEDTTIKATATFRVNINISGAIRGGN